MGLLSLFFSFIFGAIIGSFLNVVILRLPKEEKLGGRSSCPLCHHILAPWDLIPVVSFLWLGGKCRYCRGRISPRYAIIELLSGVLFAFAWQHVHPDGTASALLLFKYWTALAVLLAVFTIDLEHYLILDKVIFPGGLIVALLNLSLDIVLKQPILSFQGYFFPSVIAAVVAALPFFAIWYFSKGLWMGFGDVKLALFLGIILGWPVVFMGLFIAVTLGGLISLLLLAFTQKTLKSQIPFGTFLSLGAFLALFYGQSLIQWYLSLLGY